MGWVLRDSAQVAVDQAVLSARRLAIVYRDAAGLVENDAAVRGLFEALAGECEAMVESLGHTVERLGALPSEHDPDRESLRKLVRHARSLFGDERLGLIREAERGEDELGARLAEALEQIRGHENRERLETQARRVESAQRRLADARVRVTSER